MRNLLSFPLGPNLVTNPRKLEPDPNWVAATSQKLPYNLSKMQT